MPKVIGCADPVVSAWAGMGMYSGAVPGNGKVFHWDQAAFHGRQDSHKIEEALQTFLKVKRDIFPVHDPFFDRFGDFGLCLLGFLFFPFGLIRLFTVVGRGEQFVPGI